jgi:protein-disulfide isomerase
MSTTGWESALTVPVDPERDHIEGPPDAPVTLVEYGDFQCPYCGDAYRIVEEVRSRLGDRMRFVFRHFPITTAHEHAEHAAEAAEAAAAQGKFWPMHAVLYEHQSHLADEDLRRYAAQIGLDVDRFDDDLAQHAYADRVREDFMGGVRSGVNGTPSFFIDGQRYDESYDVEPLTAALERAAGG